VKNPVSADRRGAAYIALEEIPVVPQVRDSVTTRPGLFLRLRMTDVCEARFVLWARHADNGMVSCDAKK
jgi:hypothetical protein